MQPTHQGTEAPAIHKLAFHCPHSNCRALAKQSWFSIHAEPLAKNASPYRLAADWHVNADFKGISEEKRAALFERAQKVLSGALLLTFERAHIDFSVTNLAISQCFNCDQIALWINDAIVWPNHGEAPLPNPDLPEEVRRDYEEASAVINISPRGAAALLRLAVQKICKNLGEQGENINDDIAALVRKGLDRRVQQALDIVRVVGNNAVHPGQLDLKDDRATAEKLFELINLIADIMISQPKHINQMFEGLPEKSRKAIAKRDGDES